MLVERSIPQRLLAIFLSILMVLVLLPTAAAAGTPTATAHIGFTSDVHGRVNNLTTWLDELNDLTATLNQFIFGGDFDYNEYNCNVTAANCVDEVNKAYPTAAIYTARGNHDVPDADEFKNKEKNAITDADSSNIGYNTGLVYDGLDYAVYIIDSTNKTDNSTTTFSTSEINDLSAALEALATADAVSGFTRPVFVISHAPLHYNASRTPGNTTAAFKAINNYSNVVFLWGHNHSQSESLYGTVKVPGPGSTLQTTSSKSDIYPLNFTYASMGAMYSGNNGAYGLLATVDKYTNSSTVTLEYKDLSGTTVSNSSVTIPESNEISTVTITGIDTPVAGNAPDTLAVASADVQSPVTVSWYEDGTSFSGAYTANTTYTATMTLEAIGGKVFTSSTAATVNGNEAISTVLNGNGTLTVTYAFTAQAPEMTIYKEVDALATGGNYIIVANDGTANYAVTYQTVVNSQYRVGATPVEITSGAGYFDDGISLAGTDIIKPAADTLLWTYDSDQFKSVASSTYYLHGGKIDPTTGDQTSTGDPILAAVRIPRETVYSNHKMYAVGTNSSYYFTIDNGAFGVTSTAANGDTIRIFEEITSSDDEPNPAGPGYALATSITSGDTYVIVAKTGSTAYALTTAEGSEEDSLNGALVTVSGNEVLAADITNAMKWLFTADGNGYDVTNSGDYLNRRSGGGLYISGTEGAAGYSDWIYDNSNRLYTYNNSAKNFMYLSASGTPRFFSADDAEDNNVTIYLYKIPDAPVASVAVTGVDAPMVSGTPDNSAATSVGTVSSVTWAPAVSDTFAGHTAYTVNVTLAAPIGFDFISATTATLNGQTVTPVLNANGTLTVSLTFTQTGAAPVITYELATSITPGETYVIVSYKSSTYRALTNTVVSTNYLDDAVVEANSTAITGPVTDSMLWTAESGSDVTFLTSGGKYLARESGKDYLKKLDSKPEASIGGWIYTGSNQLYLQSGTSTTKYYLYYTSSNSRFCIDSTDTKGKVEVIYLYKQIITQVKADTALSTVSGTGTYGGTGSLTATLTSNSTPLMGKTVTFTHNATTLGAATTDAHGVATLTIAQLDGINAGANAGYITATFAGDTEYKTTNATGGFAISQRAITVQADAKSKVYSDTDPDLTYTVTAGSLVDGDSLTSGALSRDSGENCGVYVITIGSLATANPNYGITFIPANFTIIQKAVTVTATASGKVYGEPDPVDLPYTTDAPSGFAFSGKLGRVAGENVGKYAITINSLAPVDENYTINFTTNDFTITPKDITVTADGINKVYGNLDPTLTFTYPNDGLVSGDAFSGALSRDMGETIGYYAITIGSLTAGSNYTVHFNSNTLLIAARPISVKAEDKSKVQGHADPEFTFALTDGTQLANGDTLSTALSGTLSCTHDETIGTYTIEQGTLVASSNYAMTFETGVFMISEKPTPVFSSVSGTGTYGGTGSLTATLKYNDTSIIGALVTFNYNGTPIGTGTTNDSGIATSDIPAEALTGFSAGLYDITVSFASNGEYNANTGTGSLNVNARPITVTANAQSKEYGTDDPALTYSCSDPSLTLTGGLSRAPGINAGQYEIIQNDLSAGTNYAITYNHAYLTITPKEITVTPNAQSKVYGTNDPELTYTFTEPGLSFTGTLSRVSGENVGEYTISKGDLSASANYTIKLGSAKLTITAKPITVTALASSKVYGENDPTLKFTVTSGILKAGDTLQGTLSRAPGENTAIYAISVGTLATANTNYNITIESADFTVTAKPITVTADAQTKVQGAADPELTYKVSVNLKTGDTFTGALSRASGEIVGTYAITQNTLSAGTNYTITYVSADLTITASTGGGSTGGGSTGGGSTGGGGGGGSTGGSGGSGVLGATTKVFTDVKDDEWYYDAVQFVVNEGLFGGTTDTTFEPSTQMTRGMLVTVLYRLAGSPAVSTINPFTDVPAGTWYTPAVLWARQNNIATGYSDNTFRPGLNLTREQMADILYNYAKYKGYDMTLGNNFNLQVYSDASKITDYAKVAMKWACGAGLISGKPGNRLAPKDGASRAEVAMILMRFYKEFLD